MKDNYQLVIVLHMLFIFCLIIFFKKDLLKLLKLTKWYEPIILVSTSILVHGITSYLVIHYFNQPSWYFESRGSSFLLMNNFYIWAKPIDVMAQQLLIVLLIARLSELKMNLSQITKLLVVGFGGAHIFQLFRTDLFIGFLYLLVAVLFSFLFPWMILKVRNGFIYNYMLHLFVYNLAAVIAWGLY